MLSGSDTSCLHSLRLVFCNKMQPPMPRGSDRSALQENRFRLRRAVHSVMPSGSDFRLGQQLRSRVLRDVQPGMSLSTLSFALTPKVFGGSDCKLQNERSSPVNDLHQGSANRL